MATFPVKYQIFISSTYNDLIPERTCVIETILRFHHFPVGMEMFNANNKEQWQVITETIDSSDIYLLIVGHMYGSLTKGKNPISFTQKEFEYALKRRRQEKLRILCFIRDKDYNVKPSFVESNPYKIEKLNNFRTLIDNSHLTREVFTSKDDLSSKVTTSLAHEIRSISDGENSFGWVKKSDIQNHSNNKNSHPAQKSLDSIVTLLVNTAQSFESVSEDVTNYFFDSKCNCTIERTRKQIAVSGLSHALVNYMNDKVGVSEIIEIIDLERQSKTLTLPHILTANDGTNFAFIVLFDRIVNPGEYIKYRYKVKIENYLQKLLDGEGEMEYFSFPKNAFKSKTDILSFPDNKLFKNLTVRLSHINKDFNVNQTIEPRIEHDRKIFEIKYDYPLEHECYIKILFSLNR